jgi:hypothetical protein
MTELFHCSPRMALKLARCNEIARIQREKTIEQHSTRGVTRKDCFPIWRMAGPYGLHDRAYINSLNA